MAVTYTTAAARDAARVQSRAALRIDPLEIALAGVSLCAIVLVLVAFSGAGKDAGPALHAPPRPLNLNTVVDAAPLESVLAPIRTDPAERREAARGLFAYLMQAESGRRTISDVRALGRARVLTSSEITEIKPMLSVRSRAEARGALLLWLAFYVLSFHAVSLLWRMRGVKGDRVLLVGAHVLTAFGLAAMVARQDPIRDVVLFVRYTQGVIAGLALAAAISFVNLRTTFVRSLSYVPLLLAFALSLTLIVFGGGPTGSGAKVNLGPVQPIEAIRILLALFLAGYFARNWELLRAVRAESIGTLPVPRWLHLPRLRYTVPVLAAVAVALLLFFLQKDLGPALMLALMFLSVYAIARGRAGLVMVGAVLLGAGFYLGYRLGISATLAERVRMWQSPWDNGARGGNQVAHALWAMATGGLFGTGPGDGNTGYIPAGYTDLILASIGEELGFLGVLTIAVTYVVIIARALRTARQASTDYAFFLGTMLALLFAVPVLLMAAGTMGLIPLTGVVTPFLSYGGSAMVANFGALGLLASIRSDPEPPAPLESFHRPLRWLASALAVGGAALLVAAARVQITQADELVVRPHLGLQADGMRRYQDNPRVLDLVRLIPRGTIVDRNGVVLAGPCTPPRGDDERCYALGGRAFHVIGDARTRLNWSASNTSYVERDAESKLRGFDDHATIVAVPEADGSDGTALRRDYRDLVPLLRHRDDPDHAAVKAAMNPRRQLRLTIDSRLQSRVAAILADYARKSASGHAAAVVIDPATGDLLASVSYPWPEDVSPPRADASSSPATDAFLDRARYGLYPPGSTFKLVTAAAALRRDAGAAAQTFTCSRLPDNRVGARVPGYARPVRDDQMDKTPHGTIDMHRALVVSCNAYFAQLAAKLGPQALLAAAQPAEIALARNDAIGRVRDTLPQAGYGQGDVLASPLRMARIAAAIASDGNIRETRIEAGTASGAPHRFISPHIAQLLARDMRGVVLEGTGRSLRGHAVPIAGKTGTAEVAGKPSHSWFVGFAPYGSATSRIAVAVLLENAGYGGSGAAPAAGEIVAAAASLGLVR